MTTIMESITNFAVQKLNSQMKFIVASQELLKKLSIVQDVIPSKSVLPIVYNAYFEVKNSELILIGTDLENSIQTALPVESEDNFNMAIPAKIIIDTLRSLPEQPLIFEYNPDTMTVEIKSSYGTYKVAAQDGNDFPKIPPISNTNASITVSLPVLSRIISKVIYAVSDDSMKPAMTGVFFDFKTSGASFVATDAQKLVRLNRSDITVSENFSFILPPKALKLLQKASAGIESVVKIDFNQSNAFFQFEENQIVCRLIDGKFPDYNSVIPMNSPNKAIINRKDLLSSLRRLDIFASKETHLGKLQFIGNTLKLTSEDIDFANQAEETINCLYEGEDMTIGFTLSLIMDLLANLDSDEIVMEMGNPTRAAVIMPSIQEENESILQIIMPIILNY
ncbi:MAG: DNA polymerase III subunit beta [Bacteroidia bacterium]|nr:MAG: DNA polymerase III subunit beta [Bacteroidia bacterium]